MLGCGGAGSVLQVTRNNVRQTEGSGVLAYRVEQHGPILRIVLRPRVVRTAWILYGGVFSIVLVSSFSILHDGGSVPSWIVMLAIVIVVPLVFYATFGESLVATPDVLRIERRALGLMAWKREYSVEEVRWVRAVEESWSECENFALSVLPRAVAGGVALSDGRVYRLLLGCGQFQLAFDVNGITRWAGPGLTDSDATQIAALVRDWVHAHQRTVDPTWT